MQPHLCLSAPPSEQGVGVLQALKMWDMSCRVPVCWEGWHLGRRCEGNAPLRCAFGMAARRS